jgi:hypothetical protein
VFLVPFHGAVIALLSIAINAIAAYTGFGRQTKQIVCFIMPIVIYFGVFLLSVPTPGKKASSDFSSRQTTTVVTPGAETPVKGKW